MIQFCFVWWFKDLSKAAWPPYNNLFRSISSQLIKCWIAFIISFLSNWFKNSTAKYSFCSKSLWTAASSVTSGVKGPCHQPCLDHPFWELSCRSQLALLSSRCICSRCRFCSHCQYNMPLVVYFIFIFFYRILQAVFADFVSFIQKQSQQQSTIIYSWLQTFLHITY